MLELKNIRITFNKGTPDEKLALDNFSLTINEGDFVTVIGGNGAGKSTLMNIICGTRRPEKGAVVLDGENITPLSEHKRAKFLGRVCQDPQMGTAPDMQVIENLALANRRGCRHSFMPGIRRAEKEMLAGKLAELGLGLETRLTTKVGTLSGGQRQAITLVMATLKRPKLLLLDEHTAALDPKTAANVLELTEKVVSDNKLTTLMITHNMKDAIRYGNRLIMLDNGHLVLDICGEEKKKLTVPDLLERFASSSGKELTNDRMILSSK